MDKKNITNKGFIPLAILLIVVIAILFTTITFSNNYDNTTVTTQLNITNTEPYVTNVNLDDTNPTGNEITLIESNTVLVYCNGTVFDYNGVPGDINNVSAVIYDTRVSNASDIDDQNYHYTNNSCINITQLNSTAAVYSCTFQVWYYANNGTWNCNMTAMDNSFINGSGVDSSPPYINELYALDVNSVLDYGNMSTGTVSSTKSFNVTNSGNMNINVTIDGYGVTNGDNLAMSCTIGTIGISNERYSLNSGTAFSSMINLTDNAIQIPNLTIQQRTGALSYNTTYWKIQVPLGVSGWCNGTIVFTALN